MNEDTMTAEDRYYARKPNACSSPIVQVRDGVLMRVHDGFSYGPGRNLIDPSTYPVNDPLQQIIKE